jgi:hypothetical protein
LLPNELASLKPKNLNLVAPTSVNLTINHDFSVVNRSVEA